MKIRDTGPAPFHTQAVFVFWILALMLAFQAGCVHAPLNKPLGQGRANEEPPNALAKGPSDLAIFMFFSGGGKRASGLSYGVLKELSGTVAPLDGQPQRLSERIELISAVSGGSFTAAYYSLHHDRIFQDFEKRYLKRSTNFALGIRFLSPFHWPALWSGYYARNDMAADYYDRTLFNGATFADLARTGNRPYLLINATDIANGEQFSFSHVYFDALASDHGSYSIARAVAASSAVPGFLSPITLKNYSTPEHPVPARQIPRRPAAPATPSFPLTRREQELREFVESYADSDSRPYVHLVDGGFSDNLGLHSIINASVLHGGLRELMTRKNIQPPGKLVIIVVNAASRRGHALSRQEKTPGTFKTMQQLSDNIGNHANARTMENLRRIVGDWQREERDAGAAQKSKTPGARAGTPEFYLVEVSFNALGDATERDYFLNLPTSFTLPGATIDRLTEVGGRLLRESPEFQRLLRDLNTRTR